MYQQCLEWYYFECDEKSLDPSLYPPDSLYIETDELKILSSRKCWRFLLRRCRKESMLYKYLYRKFQEFYRSKRYNQEMRQRICEIRRIRDRSRVQLLGDLLPQELIEEIQSYI